MLQVFPKTRPQLSKFAPKVKVVKVPVEKIGEVIGPGGKVIRSIIAQTQTTVDVDDDGTVTVTAPDEKMVAKAIEWIEGLIKEVQPGEIYEGEVKRILPFGAFVEIIPGKEGLVHVSQMSTEYIDNPNDVVQIGQRVKVRVVEIDTQGRINLSMLFGDDKKIRSKSREGKSDRAWRPEHSKQRGSRRSTYKRRRF